MNKKKQSDNIDDLSLLFWFISEKMLHICIIFFSLLLFFIIISYLYLFCDCVSM